MVNNAKTQRSNTRVIKKSIKKTKTNEYNNDTEACRKQNHI